VVFTAVDNDNVTDTATTLIRVLDKPLPPTNVAVQTLINRSFMFTDYINKITWQEDSDNSGLFTVANYRIYRKVQSADDSQFSLLTEVSAATFEYQDRGLSGADEASGYVYVITSVDDAGLESLHSAYSTKIN
jgi:fibronectin type 3 domain-containing protein